MNLGNEVIVKNFHVLVDGETVTATKKDGQIYFKISNSSDDDQNITTDQFCLDWIKRVRLTKPTSEPFKKWEITMPVDGNGVLTPAVGSILIVNMHFTNLYGYGVTDRWDKHGEATIVDSQDTAQALSARLAGDINSQFVDGMRPIIATSEQVSNKWAVVIRDNTFGMQRPTRRRLEMGMTPQPIEMYITTNVLPYTAENPNRDIADMRKSWCVEVATAASRTDSLGHPIPRKYDGIVDSTKTYHNAYLIWGLEKVSQLNSTETMCSKGFAGWDSKMDAMFEAAMSTTNGKDFFVLDIAYETLPKMGVPSARNLKELSFAAEANNGAAPQILKDILTELGYTYADNHEGIAPDTNEGTNP